MKNGRSRKYQSIRLLRVLSNDSNPKKEAFADSGNPGDLENKNTLGKIRMHEWDAKHSVRTEHV